MLDLRLIEKSDKIRPRLESIFLRARLQLCRDNVLEVIPFNGRDEKLVYKALFGRDTHTLEDGAEITLSAVSSWRFADPEVYRVGVLSGVKCQVSRKDLGMVHIRLSLVCTLGCEVLEWDAISAVRRWHCIFRALNARIANPRSEMTNGALNAFSVLCVRRGPHRASCAIGRSRFFADESLNNNTYN